MSALFDRLAKKYKTPRQVQRLIDTFEYNRKDTQKSALMSYRAKTVHCLEAAMFCAAILEKKGYPPTVMSLESKDNIDHVIFIFKKNKRWGSVSQSRDRSLRGRAPVFRTLRDLAWSYVDAYVDQSGRILAYQKANLDEMGKIDWRAGKKNVWRIEDYLINLKHIKLKSSEKRYKKFFKRYKKFGELPLRKNWW